MVNRKVERPQRLRCKGSAGFVPLVPLMPPFFLPRNYLGAILYINILFLIFFFIYDINKWNKWNIWNKLTAARFPSVPLFSFVPLVPEQ